MRRQISRAHRLPGDETVWHFRFYTTDSWLADVLEGGHVDAVLAAGCDPGAFTLPADLVWIEADLLTDDATLSLGADLAARIEAAELTRKLAWLAEHDALTGLRRASTLADDERPAGNWCLLRVDLDAFADLAETLGPASGDLTLCAVARALTLTLPLAALCARIDDEAAFCVLVREDLSDTTHRAVTVALNQRFRLGPDGAAEVQPSFCTSSAHGDGRRAIADALQATQPSFTQLTRSIDGGGLAERLGVAVDQDEFTLAFQPIVDLRTGAITAVEALLRWHGESIGNVAPDLFIPVAERSGSIVRIGDWVLERACRDAAIWLDRSGQSLRLGVNVSPQQLQPDLIARVRRLLEELPIGDGQIELEVPGSAFASLDDTALAAIRQLRDLGIGLAIDGFVLATTPLSVLRRTRIDTYKLGRDQVARLAVPTQRASLEQHIGLAHRLGGRVIGVGVETAEQLLCLRTGGCDEAQGFHLSLPVDAEELLQLMRAHPPIGVQPPLVS